MGGLGGATPPIVIVPHRAPSTPSTIPRRVRFRMSAIAARHRRLTRAFAAFNVAYAIISLFFPDWWCEHVLFDEYAGGGGIEHLYYTMGGGFLCAGISAMALILDGADVPDAVKTKSATFQVANWVVWVGFEAYFLFDGHTGAFVGALQLALCVGMLALSTAAAVAVE